MLSGRRNKQACWSSISPTQQPQPTTHLPAIRCRFVKSKDTAQQSKRKAWCTFHCLPLSLPVITKTQPSRTFENWHASYFAFSTALQLSMVAREKPIHGRDVSAQQHLWLDTIGERYMCSFICKEEILCSRGEQHRARSFTRPLPLLHLV